MPKTDCRITDCSRVRVGSTPCFTSRWGVCRRAALLPDCEESSRPFSPTSELVQGASSTSYVRPPKAYGRMENRQIVEDEQRQWRCPPPSRHFWIAAEASSGRGTSVQCPGHPPPHKNLRPSLSQTGTSPAPRTLATEIPRILEQKWAWHVLANLACFVSEPNNLSKHDTA